MKVSAVSFIFRKGLNKGTERLVVHKIKPDGNYIRKIFSSPESEDLFMNNVSPAAAKNNIMLALNRMKKKNSPAQFISAGIKDGLTETEINSLYSDKLYRVRTKDARGLNSYSIADKDEALNLLEKRLNFTDRLV